MIITDINYIQNLVSKIYGRTVKSVQEMAIGQIYGNQTQDFYDPNAVLFGNLQLICNNAGSFTISIERSFFPSYGSVSGAIENINFDESNFPIYSELHFENIPLNRINYTHTNIITLTSPLTINFVGYKCSF